MDGIKTDYCLMIFFVMISLPVLIRTKYTPLCNFSMFTGCPLFNPDFLYTTEPFTSMMFTSNCAPASPYWMITRLLAGLGDTMSEGGGNTSKPFSSSAFSDLVRAVD